MGVLLDEVHFPGGPAVLDVNALAIFPAQTLETLTECRYALLTFRIAFHDRREDADRGFAARLLRACRKRPRCRRAADKRDEFASIHRLAPHSEGLTLPCCGLHCASRQILAANVRFVPKADILRCGRGWRYSITLSARTSSASVKSRRRIASPQGPEHRSGSKWHVESKMSALGH